MANVTRRQIVKGAGSLGIVAAMPAVARAEPILPIQLAAFDSNHAASRAFAAEARRLGLTTQDTRGDITPLYTGLLRRGGTPIAIAGLTPMVQLFSLRMMVENPRLRLVFLQSEGSIFGPESARRRLAERHASDLVPVAAARLFAGWHPDDATASAARSNIAAGDARAIRQDTLVAWLIAPVVRASIV